MSALDLDDTAAPGEAAEEESVRRWTVGVNEAGLLGSGWYQRAREARCGVEYRPAHPDGATLRLGRIERLGAIELLLYGASAVLGQPVWVDAALRLANDPDAQALSRVHWRLDLDLWCLRVIDWGVDLAGLDVALSLTTRPILVPHEHFGNGDHRPMGVYLAAAVRYDRDEAAQGDDLTNDDSLPPQG